jgi:LAGLIDADG DNA endonuclease family
MTKKENESKLWARWTPVEVRYLLEHPDDSHEDVGAALGRPGSAVRRKRYALGLRLSPEHKLAIRRAARARGKDVWPSTQKTVLVNSGRVFLDTYGPDCDAKLKPLIDAAGPLRTLRAIQLMRSYLGIVEGKDARTRRLKQAAQHIDYEKRRQIPATLTWDDLPLVARSVLLGSLLGDGGIYEANGIHYYSETHKLPHKDYLLWKLALMPPEFRKGLRQRDSTTNIARCIWETGVSSIFTLLRKQFYLELGSGHKTMISDWVIEQIDFIALLIWLLDDGRNTSKVNGLPNLEIAIPRWNRQDVKRACETLNEKYGLQLYIRPHEPRPGVLNNIVIPACDRDRLLPEWWHFADEYGLPECIRYKIPKYNPPFNGRRRLHWEEQFGLDAHGLRTVILRTDRVELANTAFTMRQNGASLKTIGDFLAASGHPTTPRYLIAVWQRLGHKSSALR